MSDYLAKINHHVSLRISIYTLILGSSLSLIGFWIYPNLILYLFWLGIFSIFLVLTPFLIVLKFLHIEKRLHRNIIRYLISIWVGLFFTFITPHQIFTKLGETKWEKTAYEVELQLNEFYNSHGHYPKNMNTLINWIPEKNGVIQQQYMELIEIKYSSINKIDSYELMTGFGIADYRYWDSDLKKWKAVF